MLILGILIGILIGVFCAAFFLGSRKNYTYLDGYYFGLSKFAYILIKTLLDNKKDFNDCASSSEAKLNKEWNNAIDYCINIINKLLAEKEN